MPEGRTRLDGSIGITEAQLWQANWSASSIGEPGTWPQSWHAAVRLIMDSSFPMCLKLGPDHVLAYNDAFIPLLGSKHPAIGLPVRDVFPEIWDNLRPIFAHVTASGAATQARDRPFFLLRRGFLEQCYFTLSFSPVRDDDGLPTGVLTTALETTHQVQIGRRLACLESLVGLSIERETVAELAARALSSVAEHEPATQYAALHVGDSAGMRLVAHVGTPDEAFASLPIEELSSRSAPTLWSTPHGRVCVVPLRICSTGLSSGVLIAAVDQCRPPEESLDFLQSVGGYLAVAMGNIQSRESEHAARQFAEVANRAKDDFLAMLSHELRSPLSAILGWVGWLRKRVRDPTVVAEAVDVIERNARAQRHLVDDLLDVTRIAAGELRVDREPLASFGGIVGAIVSSWRPAAEARGVHLTHEIGKSAGPLLADPYRLEQVTWNLLANALKFTPAGGRVAVHCERIGSDVALVVRDTGPGIAEDHLPRIFDRFYQAPSLDRRPKGLGIGLAIAREIVVRHGGTIEAGNANPGPGAVFTVRLPVATGDQQAPCASAPASAAVLPFAPLRVLLVEDDRSAATAVRRVLHSAGHRARLATTVADAEHAIRSGRFDVVISDLALPDGNGLDLLRQLRAIRPDTPSLRGILLTGFVMPADAESARAAGYSAHVAKPFDAAHLLDTLRRVTEQENRQAVGKGRMP